jgi:adenylate cyclase
MGREIERKFLLRDDSWRSAISRSLTLQQAYLGAHGRASVRVRIADSHATLNIKSRTLGISRDEYEYEIPLNDARELLSLCAGAPVTKTRHLVIHAGHSWEIDEFDGANAGLVVAEIELDDPGENFARPSWLGAEVSMDPRYYNAALARSPYCEWAPGSVPPRDAGQRR